MSEMLAFKDMLSDLNPAPELVSMTTAPRLYKIILRKNRWKVRSKQMTIILSPQV